MAKRQLHQSSSNVATPNGVGRVDEQNITIDDNCLPSPQELEAYKRLDPNLLPFFMDIARKEQEHRHKTDDDKVKLVGFVEKKTFRTNRFGMFCATIILFSIVLFAAYAMYLGHEVLGGIFGGGSLVGVLSTLAQRSKD